MHMAISTIELAKTTPESELQNFETRQKLNSIYLIPLQRLKVNESDGKYFLNPLNSTQDPTQFKEVEFLKCNASLRLINGKYTIIRLFWEPKQNNIVSETLYRHANLLYMNKLGNNELILVSQISNENWD